MVTFLLIVSGGWLVVIGTLAIVLAFVRTQQKQARTAPVEKADWLGGLPSLPTQNGPPQPFGPAAAVEALRQGKAEIRWDPKTQAVIDEPDET